jgi:arylsulfatase A-like enzyme
MPTADPQKSLQLPHVVRGGVLALAALLATHATACRRSEPPPSGPAVLSVFRLLEASGFEPDKRQRVLIWHLGDDYRTVLAMPAPGRVEIGPVSGRGCVLRFGLGVHERVWGQGDGVEFRASVKRGGEEEPIFSELFAPAEHDEPRWSDREAAIPDADGDAFTLVLETGPGPAGNRRRDHAGWASPYLECAAPAVAVAKPGRPHVILISIDTLRRDRLGVYGYPGETSPALDALAAESLVFDDCFSQASYTTPSHASMFTGLYPDQHGAGHSFPEAPLADEQVTVAEVLGAAGYRSVAVTAGGMVSGKFGFSQGFEEWTERQRTGLGSALPEVYDALRRDDGRPLFLFLHTYDVHGPYREPPSDFAAQESPDWQELLAVPHLGYQKLERFSGFAEVDEAYDAGIRSVDARLAELFAYLRQIGVYDEALIVVTSDHGETLYDRRNYFGHGYTLHDEEVRVPLLVRLPGGGERGRRAELVEQVDLLPMILAVTGVPAELELPGRDPLAADPGEPRALVHGETSHTGARYARNGGWKVIAPTNQAWEKKRQKFTGVEDRFETGWQIYHLAEDSGERDNLFGKREQFPPEVRRLIRALRETGEPGLSFGETPEVDEDLAESLRALGYID